ncbi:hypothetical protein RFI_38603 [Reticulomyxa filosa]|uniref:Uncharacterized protein n=1 Tax=Reticulomyxa filosa TaxID=46433 RepID=X6LDV3_RETFI|nr:hypothetical protein RFI_38603 [Reticulomyxa filosa]|eukprot:ETN98884.1 hypothetical protein RFI_38603 [Reticulomyxa filosa]
MKKQHLIKIFLKISTNRVVFKYHFGFLLSLSNFFKNFILSFTLKKFFVVPDYDKICFLEFNISLPTCYIFFGLFNCMYSLASTLLKFHKGLFPFFSILFRIGFKDFFSGIKWFFFVNHCLYYTKDFQLDLNQEIYCFHFFCLTVS